MKTVNAKPSPLLIADIRQVIGSNHATVTQAGLARRHDHRCKPISTTIQPVLASKYKVR